MGKTLKYVSEFSFPSDKGYSGSAGKQMVKGYARGGSCGPMKKADGGVVDDPRQPLMDRTLAQFIEAINNERGMDDAAIKEKIDRFRQKNPGALSGMSNADRMSLQRAIMRQIPSGVSQGLRSPRAEMARERALMGEDAGYKKGGMATRKQYPTNRSEPMVAMKKGGHVSKKIMKKFDGGYIQNPASSNVPQGVSPLTQIANPQAQPALQNMIPPGNTSLSPTAMKRGGKVGAKLVKMATGGAMVIRDPSYSPNSVPRIQQQPSNSGPRIQQQPSTNMPRQPNPYTVDARPVNQGPGTGTRTGPQTQPPVGGGRPLAPGARPRPVMGQTLLGRYDHYIGRPKMPQNQPQVSGGPRTLGPESLAPGGRPSPVIDQRQIQRQQEMTRGYSDPSQSSPSISQGVRGTDTFRQYTPQTSPPVGGERQMPQVQQQPAMKRGGAVKNTTPKSDMLYSKKEISSKNLLAGRKFYPPNRSGPLVNMAGGGKVGKVMGEFKAGELHSGSKSGPVVKSRKQAIAIGLSEARKAKK